MRDIFKAGIILLIIAGLSAGILSWVNSITKERIAQHLEQAKQKALQEVLPEAKKFVSATKKLEQIKKGFKEKKEFAIVKDMWVGYDNEIKSELSKKKENLPNEKQTKKVQKIQLKKPEIIGYVFGATPTGYSGTVLIFVGINFKDKITGVKILKHIETPGLGAKITQEDFYSQFKEKEIKEELKVVKTKPVKPIEIQAITAATISSKGVTKGVNMVVRLYKEIKKEKPNLF